MKMVEVTWRDSATQSGWHSKDELEKDLACCICESCGYLFHTNGDIVMLVMSKNDADQLGEGLTIPREAIINIRELE